jgi:hypothetical protein
MSGKDVAVEKYVVHLSAEERGQLEALIRKARAWLGGFRRRGFVEGGCLGSRRWVERQPDHRGPQGLPATQRQLPPKGIG